MFNPLYKTMSYNFEIKTEYSSVPEVFESLPRKFTSHEFLKKARESKLIGEEESIAKTKELTEFLLANARQESSKTWVKKSEHEAAYDVLENATIILKSNGYKVSKPVQWVEV